MNFLNYSGINLPPAAGQNNQQPQNPAQQPPSNQPAAYPNYPSSQQQPQHPGYQPPQQQQPGYGYPPQQQYNSGYSGQIGFAFPDQQPPPTNSGYGQQPTTGYPNGYPNQQPQFGYPGGTSQYQPQQQPSTYGNVPPVSQYQPQHRPNWDINEYLRSIFSSFDQDRNGFITQNELQVALSRTQPAYNFDSRTIDFILSKFDSNRDNRITFDEFFNLYAYINEEYGNFMIADANQSGTIEVQEFANLLRTRGANVSPQCVQFILNNVQQMLQRPISFDIFCRVNARFDYLCKAHRMMQHQHGAPGLDQYLSEQFFAGYAFN